VGNLCSLAGTAIDFLEQCLTFSPKREIEVGEALQHPYLAVSAIIIVLA